MKTPKGKMVRVMKGKWYYRFMIGGQTFSGPTGLDGTSANQKAAEKFAVVEKLRVEKEGPKVDDTEALKPFDEAAGEFITWCYQSEYREKPSTAGRIETSMRSAVDFFKQMPVQNIDAAAFEEYKQHRFSVHKVLPITVRHDLHAMSTFMWYAIKKKWAVRNPLVRGQHGKSDVKIPSDKDAVREHVLTLEEEQAYFAAAETLHKKHLKSHRTAQPNMIDLAKVMLDQGARPEEVLAFQKGFYNPEARTMLIVRGKSRAARRTLELTGEVVEILDRRAALDSPWLFPSDRNPGHHLTKLNCTHERICRDAGVGCVIYDFRHTYATRWCAANNGDIVRLAKILGHSNLRTVQRYVHPEQEGIKTARDNFEAAKLRKRIKVV